jgi:hypothetical protein
MKVKVTWSNEECCIDVTMLRGPLYVQSEFYAATGNDVRRGGDEIACLLLREGTIRVFERNGKSASDMAGIADREIKLIAKRDIKISEI